MYRTDTGHAEDNRCSQEVSGMVRQSDNQEKGDRQARLVNNAESMRRVRAEDLRDTETERKLFDPLKREEKD